MTSHTHTLAQTVRTNNAQQIVSRGFGLRRWIVYKHVVRKNRQKWGRGVVNDQFDTGAESPFPPALVETQNCTENDTIDEMWVANNFR